MKMVMLKPRFLVVVLMAVWGLSACKNQTSFGSTNQFGANGPSGGGGQFGTVSQNSIDYFQNTIGDRVVFLVDQSNLTEEAQGMLDLQAAWLIENAHSEVLIEGHADERGTREYNLALGARRASAVRNYLVSRGVSADQLQIISYGKERPIEVCSQELCYSKNRRAVTAVESSFAG